MDIWTVCLMNASLLHSLGMMWVKQPLRRGHEHRSERCTEMALTRAARGGHLNVLQFLHTHYPEKFTPAVMNWSADRGHLAVVRWIHVNRQEGCTTHAMDAAAYQGLLHLLEHRTEGFPGPAMETPQNLEVLCLFNGGKCGSEFADTSSRAEQLEPLKIVFEHRPAFFRGYQRCLAEAAVVEGNIRILDWVNQFGVELLSTTPIREAVGRGDWRLLGWFHENGFQSDLLELAVEKGQLDVARWLCSHGYEINSLRLVEIAGKNENVPLMRWLVEHGPVLSLSVAAKLALECHHVEITWWLAEADRVQLVLATLREEDRKLLWWLLTRTHFENESGRDVIRCAVQCASKDIRLWLQENLVTGQGCSWCFGVASTSGGEQRADEVAFLAERR